MSHFRQAAPDPDKAARDGVTKYVPSRSQINTAHTCQDCDRTAKWWVTADGVRLAACDSHRRDYSVTAGVYTEERIR